MAWFHYSGHGTQISGELSKDEADGKDEALVPVDWDKTAKGLISDDFLYDEFVSKLNGAETFACLDCCHSGSALDLQYYLDLEQGKFVPTPDPPANQVEQDPGQPVRGKRPLPEGTKILQIAGCTDEQTSKELTWKNEQGEITKRGGLLTLTFLETIKAEPHFDKISLLGFAKLLATAGQKQKQKPYFSSSYPMDPNTAFEDCIDGK